MVAIVSPQLHAVGESPPVVTNAVQNTSVTNLNVNQKPTYAAQLQSKQSASIASKVELFPVNIVHGEPVIEFTLEEVNNFIREEGLHQAVVIKFSYGKPELQEVRKNISSQFDIQGHCNVGQLEYRHLLIRFDLYNDYVHFLSKTTGYLKSKGDEFFFRTFPWTLDFNSKEETSRAAVWISLPGLPPNFFAKRSLMSIASAVGKALAVDKATQDRTRPSAARVKVILDLLDNHPKKVKLHVLDRAKGKSIEFYQEIVYDNLPKYCTFCKHQGHDNRACRLMKEQVGREMRTEEVTGAVPRVELGLVEVNGTSSGKLQGDARDFLNTKRAGLLPKVLLENDGNQRGDATTENVGGQQVVQKETGSSPHFFEAGSTKKNGTGQVVPGGVVGIDVVFDKPNNSMATVDVHKSGHKIAEQHKNMGVGKLSDIEAAKNAADIPAVTALERLHKDVNTTFKVTTMDAVMNAPVVRAATTQGGQQNTPSSTQLLNEKRRMNEKQGVDVAKENHIGQQVLQIAQGIRVGNGSMQNRAGEFVNVSDGTKVPISDQMAGTVTGQLEDRAIISNNVDVVKHVTGPVQSDIRILECADATQLTSTAVTSDLKVTSDRPSSNNMILVKHDALTSGIRTTNVETAQVTVASIIADARFVVTEKPTDKSIDEEDTVEENHIDVMELEYAAATGYKINVETAQPQISTGMEQATPGLMNPTVSLNNAVDRRTPTTDTKVVDRRANSHEKGAKVWSAVSPHKKATTDRAKQKDVAEHISCTNSFDALLVEQDHGENDDDTKLALLCQDTESLLEKTSSPDNTTGQLNSKHADDRQNNPQLYISSLKVAKIIKQTQLDMMVNANPLIMQPLVTLNTAMQEVPSQSLESYGEHVGESGQMVLSTGNKANLRDMATNSKLWDNQREYEDEEVFGFGFAEQSSDEGEMCSGDEEVMSIFPKNGSPTQVNSNRKLNAKASAFVPQAGKQHAGISKTDKRADYGQQQLVKTKTEFSEEERMLLEAMVESTIPSRQQHTHATGEGQCDLAGRVVTNRKMQQQNNKMVANTQGEHALVTFDTVQNVPHSVNLGREIYEQGEEDAILQQCRAEAARKGDLSPMHSEQRKNTRTRDKSWDGRVNEEANIRRLPMRSAKQKQAIQTTSSKSNRSKKKS